MITLENVICHNPSSIVDVSNQVKFFIDNLITNVSDKILKYDNDVVTINNDITCNLKEDNIVILDFKTDAIPDLDYQTFEDKVEEYIKNNCNEDSGIKELLEDYNILEDIYEYHEVFETVDKTQTRVLIEYVMVLNNNETATHYITIIHK